MKSTLDKTLHAVFVMHEAWDRGQVFLASTKEQADAKAEAFIKASVSEYWNGPGCGEGDTIEEWIEMCFEQGSWTLEDAEVNS